MPLSQGPLRQLPAFIKSFALAGAAISSAFAAAWWIINSTNVFAAPLLYDFQQITLLLWPSSLWLIATDSASMIEQFEIFLLSVAANTVLYGALGAIIWYGVAKQRIALLVPVLAIGALWRWLLSL
jgi:hypothetical protein